MQLESLWTVVFAAANDTSIGHGGGVVIFETDRIFGGDASYYYLGTFSVNNGILEGNVKITKHGTGESIFGTGNEFEMKLSGEYEEGVSEFSLNGMQLVNSEPTAAVAVKLTYRSPLP